MPTLVALLVGLLLVPATAQAQQQTSCRELRFPVSVAGLAQTVSGTLCTPAGGARTVQVLVPGGLYNRDYWDIGVHQQTRSFRQAMNRAGYATLAIDRLGTGQSSTPPSVLLTVLTQAAAVHQVVQALRAGERSPRFDRVLIGGHSLGSAIAIVVAANYRDVDGVLVTAMGHRLNVLGLVPIFATFIPAALDPAFAGRTPDPGYLTTSPGTRFSSLHRPGPYDPAVEAADESTKDVVAAGELVDGALLGTVLPYTRLVDVPVLTVMAAGDPTFCGPLATDCASTARLLRSEQPFYAPAARLSAHVVDGYGHSLNYAPNAPGYHAAVVRWADRVVGSPA
ncbi:alpha/beta hydrolase [Actinophytocola sediminis]